MRAELERLLHQTLRSMGISEGDVHMIVEWIADEDDEMRRTWMLRAAGTGAIGVAFGVVAGMWLCGALAP